MSGHPLRTQDVEALISKKIGLPGMPWPRSPRLVANDRYFVDTAPFVRVTPPSSRRTITMPELTTADMADYLITGRLSGGIPDRKIRAAYVTGDEKLPGMLVFKDHQHQVKAVVPQDAVLSVERLDSEHVAEKPEPAGFKTTTQVMERAGIKPEGVL
jgi:hypothetical protein